MDSSLAPKRSLLTKYDQKLLRFQSFYQIFHHVLSILAILAIPSFQRFPEISASKEVQGATGQLQGNPCTLDGRRTLCHGRTHQEHSGDHSHHWSEGRHGLAGLPSGNLT